MAEDDAETSPRAAAALAMARELARGRPTSSPRDGRPGRRVFAVGDPQAGDDRFFALLDAKGLLGEDGRLRPDVALVSIGDHFDWGPPSAREQAAESGLAILAWLASHPADQATLLAGN